MSLLKYTQKIIIPTLFAVGVLGGFILIKSLRIRNNIVNAAVGAMVIIGLLLMLLFNK